MFYLVLHDAQGENIAKIITWSEIFSELVYYYFKQYGFNKNFNSWYSIMSDDDILKHYEIT